jgi:beta-galactosidase
MSITDAKGKGLKFTGNQLLKVSAHDNLLEDFESPRRTDGRIPAGGKLAVLRHPYDVKKT